MKRILFVALVVCLLLASPISIHAQFETASVLGYVRDGSGAVVSGATVSLVNQETKTQVTAQNNTGIKMASRLVSRLCSTENRAPTAPTAYNNSATRRGDKPRSSRR